MFPPGAHDEIWAIQRTLDFAGTVAGVDTEALAGKSAMGALMATYGALYGRHRDDRVLETDQSSTDSPGSSAHDLDRGRELARGGQERLRAGRAGRPADGAPWARPRRCPSGSALRVRGASNSSAWAARSGSRWPGPRREPQPQIGTSARSSPAAPIARMPSKRSVSPAW